METTVEAIPERSTYYGIYDQIIKKIMALPKGQSLKMSCKDYGEVKKVRHGIRENGKKLNCDIATQRRENVLWAWDKNKSK